MLEKVPLDLEPFQTGGGVFYSVCSPGKKHPIKDTKELLGRYLYVWIIRDDLDDLQMMDADTYRT